jgi:hypothetical protein
MREVASTVALIVSSIAARSIVHCCSDEAKSEARGLIEMFCTSGIRLIPNTL